MSYNGYPNWETWNVNLWIDNDEFLYREQQRWIRRQHNGINARDIEEFVRDLMPDGTPDMDNKTRLDDVDWIFLAGDWEEERLENDA